MPARARLSGHRGVALRWVRGAGLVLLSASLNGCSLWGMEGGPGGAGVEAPMAVSSPAAVEAGLGADGVQRVQVSVDDELQFVPSLVRARTGIIEFTFRNIGSTPHDVQLSQVSPSGAPNQTSFPQVSPSWADLAPAVSTGNLNGGQVSTIRVTIERAGQYPYPCLYHLSSGMRGLLDVR